MESMVARLQAVQERISQAEAVARRSPGSARLVAIGKTFSAAVLEELMALGHRRFGENRIQEAEAKAARLGEAVEWHLVGHLQTNKARRAAALFPWIHSVDSLKLARHLSRAAAAAGRCPSILVQVDLAGEETKFGIPAPDLHPVLEAISSLPCLNLAGLMVLPPAVPDPEAARPYFSHLRELGRQAVACGLLPDPHELSMGMSHDYAVAVEEGATLVRVGSALFGPRSDR